MSHSFKASERDRPANGTAEAARADEAVAHGRAHLAYQRRVAAESLHRDNRKAMGHNTKDRRWSH